MERNTLEVWFVTGSQHLYGPAALAQVAENSRQVVAGLNASSALPLPVVFKPVVTTPESILAVCREANAAPQCAGLICWMHTFSPAKMWIGGLAALDKPHVASAHPVQSRPAVGHDRHGFHEPEPGGSRGPRVRVYLHADAQAAQGGRRPLAGAGRTPAAGGVDAPLRAWAKCGI